MPVQLQDYMTRLSNLNGEAVYLLNEGLALELANRLEGWGFSRTSGSQDLSYSEKKVAITYQSQSEDPFKMVLNEEDSEAVAEATRTLDAILMEVMEDI